MKISKLLKPKPKVIATIGGLKIDEDAARKAYASSTAATTSQLGRDAAKGFNAVLDKRASASK